MSVIRKKGGKCVWMNIGHKYKSDMLLDKMQFFFFLYVWCKQELIKGTGEEKNDRKLGHETNS